MHLLLLVSNQEKTITMGVYKLKHHLISNKTKKKDESKLLLNQDKILCNHCKRTASNGIRCLGICVADNDY